MNRSTFQTAALAVLAVSSVATLVVLLMVLVQVNDVHEVVDATRDAVRGMADAVADLFTRVVAWLEGGLW